MPSAYAVTWREANGIKYSGRLELMERYLRLEGRNPTSGGARHLAYGDIAALHMARHARDRIDGRQTLVVERHDGEAVLIADVGQPGALAELAHRLAASIEAGPSGQHGSSPAGLTAWV